MKTLILLIMGCFFYVMFGRGTYRACKANIGYNIKQYFDPSFVLACLWPFTWVAFLIIVLWYLLILFLWYWPITVADALWGK